MTYGQEETILCIAAGGRNAARPHSAGGALETEALNHVRGTFTLIFITACILHATL